MGLYVMTPAEKLVVNFFILTLLALLLVSATIWLPWSLTRALEKFFFYATGQQISESWTVGNDVLLQTMEQSRTLMNSAVQQQNASIQIGP